MESSMAGRLTTIEFKAINFNTDHEDLSQECTAYMKTKQFMAKRIHEQQEEIESLKQNVIFYSGKYIQLLDIVKDLKSQIGMIKPKEFDADASNNNLATSYVLDDLGDNLNTKKNYDSDSSSHVKGTGEEIQILKENVELHKEIEKLNIDLLDRTHELNKIKSDKFILFNELNELVNNLRRTNLDKLNAYFKTNSDTYVTKNNMPSAKGIKYNILSAQSQISKILHTDSITRKLNKVEDSGSNNDDQILVNKQQMKDLDSILTKTEADFDSLLDRKLSKKSRPFLYC